MSRVDRSNFGKKNEGKEYKKPSMRLESNVEMIRGNKTANKYASHLKFITQFKKQFLESRNINGPYIFLI